MRTTDIEVKGHQALVRNREYLMNRLYQDGSALVLAYTMKKDVGIRGDTVLDWATVGTLTPNGWKNWGALNRPALARLRGHSPPRPVRTLIPFRPYPLDHDSLRGLIPLHLMDRGRVVEETLYIEIRAHQTPTEE